MPPDVPPMPPDAVVRWADLIGGRGTNLTAWRELWQTGLATGESIGLAKGLILASLIWLAIGLVTLSVCLALRGK